MQLLADESCDFAVVRALRSAGHDVKAISESLPDVPDEVVLSREKRELITEDKDFGQLVYADRRATAGVLLLRFSAKARREVRVGGSRGAKR